MNTHDAPDGEIKVHPDELCAALKAYHGNLAVGQSPRQDDVRKMRRALEAAARFRDQIPKKKGEFDYRNDSLDANAQLRIQDGWL